MNFNIPDISLTGDPLDRCDALRKQPGAIEKLRENPQTLYLVLQANEILVNEDGTLALVNSAILPELKLQDPGPVFLGVEPGNGRPWFTISPDPDHDASMELLQSVGQFVDLRHALSALPREDLALCGRAVSLMSWHRTHRFCAGCGKPTRTVGGAEKRICDACKTEHFPRVDPAVIMMVTHQDKCLLGRNASWPEGRFSTLAGFVEPGESIEEACRREVMEEAGIKVSKVSYGFSQPWPFPHSIMIGLFAEALTTEIELEDELEEARWFTRTEIKDMLAGNHPKYLQPFADAASGVLLRVWLQEN